MLWVVAGNFAGIDKPAEEAGGFDFGLTDLGVASMQLDMPERGFSYKHDGPLDLRLNPSWGNPASTLLKEASATQLENLFNEYADEPYARNPAIAVKYAQQCGNAFETTLQLTELISDALQILPAR